MSHSRRNSVTAASHHGQTPAQGHPLILNLWIHEASLSKHEAWLNYDLFPRGTCKPGDIVEVRAARSRRAGISKGDGPGGEGHTDNSHDESGDAGGARRRSNTKSSKRQAGPSLRTDDQDDKHRYLFVVRQMDPELRQKQPNMQISLAASVATAFGFQPRSSVVVTVVQKELHEASYIEISFRDQYLSRSDMWRMATNNLCDTCVYRGKKLLFVGTIKAQIRQIYVRGKKVQSAYFSSRTRPIFRSESSRYAIFIQMSREMWHFDTEGSGEIVFNKLINGFLPELFKRWRKINAHHLVSIVLFTRVIYDEGTFVGVMNESELSNTLAKPGASYKDFFRVVVSSMASTDWAVILHQLKKEFSVFLRDVLLQPDTPTSTQEHYERKRSEPVSTSASPHTLDSLGESEENPPRIPIIAGRPSAAIHGNVLEAVNLALTQFSKDFVDRDLVRTGISVVVVTPGTGHFEVDYETLRMTTENLVSHGVGIDLVCLAKMPLHSVPLFKYRIPNVEPQTPGVGVTETNISSPPPSAGPAGTFRAGISPPKAASNHPASAGPGEYVYAIPHWIDISFWSSSMQSKSSSRNQKNLGDSAQKRQFVARCKMYELQMMGIMENEISAISIPFIHESPLYVPYTRVNGKARIQQISGSLGNQSVNPTSLREWEKKEEASLFNWMDDHDYMVFRPLSEVKEGIERIKRKRKQSDERRQEELLSLLGQATQFEAERATQVQEKGLSEPKSRERGSSISSRKEYGVNVPTARASTPTQGGHQILSTSAGSSSTGTGPLSGATRLARHLSFGFRGFGGGGTPKAVASTSLSIQGPILTRGFAPEPEILKTSENPNTPAQPSSSSISNKKSYSTDHDSSDSSMTVEKGTTVSNWPSRPISIKAPTSPVPNAITALERTQERRKPSYAQPMESHKDRAQIDILRAASISRSSGPRIDMTASGSVAPSSLSPTSALAPWFSLINPSNPKKSSENSLTVYRRWQHVFPRPLRTASVKWKSLCSPAALPLTTEQFPTPEQLKAEYKENFYTISQNEDDEDLVRNREELVREMISQRFEQGFQIVVGSAVSESASGNVNIFDKNFMAKAGSSVFMSMGSQIHQLICDVEYNVQVKRYMRKPTVSTSGGKLTTTKYTPYIRTLLCDKYIPKVIDLGKGNPEYNWNYVDQFLGGYESNFTEQLRFCRSRFVLIPTDPPQAARRHNNPGAVVYSEDSDEEIRLEGIKKLTQLFQRNRYIPPEDRNFERASKKKDPNPLEILYKTFDPSVVVAQQLESLPLTTDQMDASTRRSQLFVGTEMFERSNLNLKTLATELHGPKGVRLQNRIWHLNFHQKCFIGSELITWMMENFRDLESRGEAVELANDFMKSGLFHHVENRHPLRDGNYFYQFSNDYSIARPSSKGGWFGGRSRPVEKTASIPPVPQVSDSASPNRSRSSTVAIDDTAEPVHTGPRRKIALSKPMKYDVDTAKASYRPEIINLHYDRLHNPDNCYHIRIDWMNVTCKLIEDAVSLWARTVDRYGLFLVEAPIDEIASIPLSNPFRAPVVIKPVLPPPKEGCIAFDSGGASVDMTASFSAALSKPDPLFYYKAILKKSNFVLDAEAAKNFPPDVDVVFSWGKPNYKYSQYIHRSGVVFAQITDDGTFLLMANRLYTQRVGPTQKYERVYPDGWDNPRTYHSGASQSIGFGYGNREGQTSVYTSTFPQPSYLSVSLASPAGGGGSYVTPEMVKEELAQFCQDEEELRKFYEEVDRKANLNSVNVNASLNNSHTNSPQGHGPACINVQQQASSSPSGPLPPQHPHMLQLGGNGRNLAGGSEQSTPAGAGCSPFWGEKSVSTGGSGASAASQPPTPMLVPLGGGGPAATTASSVHANGRNSSRSGRSSIIEPMAELGEKM
ncbi:hypothetical protein DFH27DRAFT_505338 [Peziza echinospora]|nr:hypothetical protein DFH27DRAFT_505338 [Peziza echinospora]